MASANFPDCTFTTFVRALRKTRALRGVKVIAGAPGMARTTAPGRIVLWPQDGPIDPPLDKSVSIQDINQGVVAEIWAQGSSSGSGEDEPRLQNINACRALLTAFIQALAEQGENPNDDENPGAFWNAVRVAWDPAQDTSTQGTAVRVLCELRDPIPAASDDQGHVGDNWTTGEGASVDIADLPP